MKKTSNNNVDPEILCPFESGKQILRIPESDFIERILSDPANTWGEKKVKQFDLKLWKILIDAKTKERRKKI